MVDAARRLRGNFFLCIRDVASGRTVAFTDPGGMFDAYVSGTRVGTSFLQLAETIGARPGDVDPAAVVEFLDLGKVYEGRTVLPEIRRLRPGTVYELRDGDRPRTHDLGIPSIDAGPDVGFTIEGFFQELASSLAGLERERRPHRRQRHATCRRHASSFTAIRMRRLRHGQLQRRRDRRRGCPRPRTSAPRDDP